MLPVDDRDAAVEQAARFQDERISQYWDSRRVFGSQVAGTLQLSVPIAWDVYLLYSPGVAWTGGLFPYPAFWMHQLDERRDRYLEPEELEAAVHKMLVSVTNQKD